MLGSFPPQQKRWSMAFFYPNFQNDMWRIFGLRSPAFEISYADNVYTFKTKGFGHCVGLSQYGANEMAKSGKTADEILKYYYSGVKIS